MLESFSNYNFCDIIVFIFIIEVKVMKETVYFGTYTRRTSQGLQGRLDRETGQLSNLELFFS